MGRGSLNGIRGSSQRRGSVDCCDGRVVCRIGLVIASRAVRAHECRDSRVGQLETRERKTRPRARRVHVFEDTRAAHRRPCLVEPDQGHDCSANCHGQTSNSARWEEPDAQSESPLICPKQRRAAECDTCAGGSSNVDKDKSGVRGGWWIVGVRSSPGCEHSGILCQAHVSRRVGAAVLVSAARVQ